MGTFKKQISINGKYKNLFIADNTVVDYETGEQIDLIGQLASVYGDSPFSLTTTNKVDVELD